MDYKTKFFDKTGKQIYVGDTIQIRLGKFAKSGGSERHKVIISGKNIKLVDEDGINSKYGNYILTQRVANYSVIVDKENFR